MLTSAAAAYITVRRFRALALVTAGLTYTLIVFGGIVRITGAGMACGDDWPLCNGQLIPPLDLPTLIEWGHRLFAALVGFLVFGMLAYALLRRSRLGRGPVLWSIASTLLLIVQVLLGAVTVWLELPAGSVVLHLSAASALLATLLLAALHSSPQPERGSAGTAGVGAGWALGGALYGFVLLFLGGWVANTGAGPLCQGFPLCNGRLMPEGGALVHLHWTHRLLAYLFVVYMGTAAILTLRRGANGVTATALASAVGLTVLQIGVAAAMALQDYPPGLRVLHLALGVALWAALVVWSASALDPARSFAGRGPSAAELQPRAVEGPAA